MTTAPEQRQEPTLDGGQAVAAAPTPAPTPAAPPAPPAADTATAAAPATTTPAKPAAPEQPQEPVETAAEAELKSTMSNRSKMCRAINEYWGMNNADMTHLIGNVKEDGIRRDKDGNVKFKLHSGLEVEWSQKETPSGEVQEFIGFKGTTFGGTQAFNDDTARSIIAIARTRGWQSVTVSGNLKQKEMLWLAAQEQGIPVKGFAPLPDSKIWQRLKESNPDRFEQLTQGGPTRVGVEGSRTYAPNVKADDMQLVGIEGAPQATAPAAPASTAAPAKFTFKDMVEHRIQNSKNTSEVAELTKIRDGLASGAVKLDELEDKSLRTALMPRGKVEPVPGQPNMVHTVFEGEGKGFNRIADFFKNKGIDVKPLDEQSISAPTTSKPEPNKSILAQSAPAAKAPSTP